MDWLCLICETVNDKPKYKIYNQEICKFCCIEKSLYQKHFDTCLILNKNIDIILPRHDYDIYLTSEKITNIGYPYLNKEQIVNYVISRLKYRTMKSNLKWRKRIINKKYFNMILDKLNKNINLHFNECIPKKIILNFLL
jgi:hypothetical protein